MNPHFESVSVNENGLLAVSASTLTGRLWKGSVTIFSNADDASSPEKARATTNSDASIGDVAWLSADSVLAASDSGAVELWQVVDGSPELRCLAIEMEHDAPTRCVAVNRPGSSPVALSGGEDGTIIVWKLAEDKLSAERRIKANVRGVCGLAPSLDSDGNVFASCARDDRAFLWDLRDERPALALERSTGANCVAWSSAGQIALGCDDGSIDVRDVRQPECSLQSMAAHLTCVSRVAFNPHRPALLASCGEDGRVSVVNTTNGAAVVRVDVHTDFARGLAWQRDNVVVSCGLDGQVLAHVVA